MSDPGSPKVAQPAERMTAEQFHKKWRREEIRRTGFIHNMNYPSGWHKLAEAFAEHCTAATNEELDASHSREHALVLQYKTVKQRAESAEASLAASAKEVEALNKEVIASFDAIFPDVPEAMPLAGKIATLSLRNESSAALVRELAKGLQDVMCADIYRDILASRRKAEALLSREDVKKALEGK